MAAPLLYLDHGQPDLDFSTLRQLCPQLVTGQTVGAGHRALEEVPDQVNAMLERFLDYAPILAKVASETLGSFRYEDLDVQPLSSVDNQFPRGPESPNRGSQRSTERGGHDEREVGRTSTWISDVEHPPLALCC